MRFHVLRLGAIALLLVGLTNISGCNRKKTMSHSLAVGTWAQKRPKNPIILKLNADGTGSQTLGVEPDGTRLAEPFTWTEVNGVITYGIDRGHLTPIQTIKCRLSNDKKALLWGKRGQLILKKQ